ncbi:MAG: hypothetical protein Q4D26_07640 [Clostridia bacterium]|nr:hypothetical protein [Clostridia bacterium]
MSKKNIWTTKLIEYMKTNKAGKCPICGSLNFKVEEFNYGRRSISFKCSDCGVIRHFDGCESVQKV